MKEIVISTLDKIHPLSDELKNYLEQQLKLVSLKKKDIFLKAGENGNKISFILKGLLRSYYMNSQGADTSAWFMKEGDVVVSVKSFFHQVPSEETIEALEESILLYVTYNELQFMYQHFPEFNVVGRILTEKYYVLSEDRLSAIRNRRAKDRYQYLMTNHPELLLRVPARYLSSYLGIDEATFSRLKSGV